MGRKRRDQRDRTRKQRARKRSRQEARRGGDDHASSDEDDDGAVISVAVGPRARGGEQSEHDRGESPVRAAEEEVKERGTDPGDESPGRGTVDADADGERHRPGPGGQKPSRIERMRLKKQLQKARRREKKAQREGSVISKAPAQGE